jgi:hypothetical protein
MTEQQQDAGKKPLRAIAIMSLPRLAFTDNMTCAFKAFAPIGIDMRTYTGAFWEKGIALQLQDAIDAGYDIAITLDYDTVFRQEDVIHLLRTMYFNTWIDVLFPAQTKRNTHELLFSEAENGRSLIPLETMRRDVTPAFVGHFGLTAIRLSTLAKLPKPWLVSLPDAKGEWSEDCTDADIYFWKSARKHGLGVYQLNTCHIGHIERFVVWPDRDMKPTIQAVGEKGWTAPPDNVGAMTSEQIMQVSEVAKP